MLILHGPARWRLEHVYTVHHSTSLRPSHTLPLFLFAHVKLLLRYGPACTPTVSLVDIMLSDGRLAVPAPCSARTSYPVYGIIGDTSSNTALWLFCVPRGCEWSAVVARLMCVFWGVAHECVGMASRPFNQATSVLSGYAMRASFPTHVTRYVGPCTRPPPAPLPVSVTPDCTRCRPLRKGIFSLDLNIAPPGTSLGAFFAESHARHGV